MTDYIVTCDEETATWVGNDVVSMRPIVRCRDCKYYDTAGPWCFEPSKVYIDEYGLEVCATVTPDGFCAWGERK